MRVLVTGGSGYLGFHVRRFFAADDFSRRSGKDILDPEATRQISEYDVVIHLAALLDRRPENASQVFRTNVEGTINILQNLKKDAVFIFASTKDVYGRFADNYIEVNEQCPVVYSGQSVLEWSKYIAEKYVEFYAAMKGFRSCIFRLSAVYAPPSEGNIPGFAGAFAEAINLGEPIRLLEGGRPIRDLLYVDDFSRACKLFVDSIIRNGLYNLGGGRENAATLTELISIIEEVSGLQAVLTDGESPPAPPPKRYITDFSLAASELGWKPEIGLREGLAKLFGK
ncbi:MAG: hypothetical protein C4324_11685 [Blastocatellia bacterium]